MPDSNEYHFVTHWRVESTIEEVSDVLNDAPDLVRWWPSVYLSVKQPEPGGPVELLTKGRLPYTLHWFFRVTESRRPHGFSIEAWGDFEGRGTWTFEQDGRFVNIIYDWRIRAEKPLLRYLSFLLKPVFSANHRWAMARGEESLKVELARRAGAGQQSDAQTS
jgi:hypothetical protein